MQRVPIKILPYSQVQFKFVSNHYDVHLNGSCIYTNEMCEFESEQIGYKNQGWEEVMVKIYKLNRKEKLKWIWTQWLFEKCIGYHCSYRKGKRGKDFYYRTPKWLYVKIFDWYYKLPKLN